MQDFCPLKSTSKSLKTAIKMHKKGQRTNTVDVVSEMVLSEKGHIVDRNITYVICHLKICIPG